MPARGARQRRHRLQTAAARAAGQAGGRAAPGRGGTSRGTHQRTPQRFGSPSVMSSTCRPSRQADTEPRYISARLGAQEQQQLGSRGGALVADELPAGPAAGVAPPGACKQPSRRPLRWRQAGPWPKTALTQNLMSCGTSSPIFLKYAAKASRPTNGSCRV